MLTCLISKFYDAIFWTRFTYLKVRKSQIEPNYLLVSAISRMYIAKVGTLTHSFPIRPFSTPWKHQKNVRFSGVFRCRERVHWEWMGQCAHFRNVHSEVNLKNKKLTCCVIIVDYFIGFDCLKAVFECPTVTHFMSLLITFSRVSNILLIFYFAF